MFIFVYLLKINKKRKLFTCCQGLSQTKKLIFFLLLLFHFYFLRIDFVFLNIK